MSYLTKTPEWSDPGSEYAYKSGFHTSRWTTNLPREFSYTIRYVRHNPEAIHGYLTKPYEPYYCVDGASKNLGTFLSFADAALAVRRDLEERVSAVVC